MTLALKVAPNAISCCPIWSSFAPWALLSRHRFSASPDKMTWISRQDSDAGLNIYHNLGEDMLTSLVVDLSSDAFRGHHIINPCFSFRAMKANQIVYLSQKDT